MFVPNLCILTLLFLGYIEYSNSFIGGVLFILPPSLLFAILFVKHTAVPGTKWYLDLALNISNTVFFPGTKANPYVILSKESSLPQHQSIFSLLKFVAFNLG